MEEGKMGAEELVAHTVEEAKGITGGDPSKRTAVTLDTCATMRVFRGVLAKILEAAHVIPILCDSHGLQLIIRDLLQLPSLKRSLMKLLQSLASSNILQSNTHISKLSN
jgi:hypothetical protein